VFQRSIDCLANADDPSDFREAMANTACALVSYLSLPQMAGGKPRVISSYSPTWTSQYLGYRYEPIDPVVLNAHQNPDPFSWVDWISLAKLLREYIAQAADLRRRFSRSSRRKAIPNSRDECQI
jgi:hypothetical protein